MSAKVAASSLRCMSLNRCSFDGSVHRLGHGRAPRAPARRNSRGRRRAEWLCTAARSADWSSIGCVISRSCEPNVATCARAAPFPAKHAHGRVFGVGQASTGAHAERIVDHQQHQPVARQRRRVAVDERIGEGENQQRSNSSRSESNRI